MGHGVKWKPFGRPRRACLDDEKKKGRKEGGREGGREGRGGGLPVEEVLARELKRLAAHHMWLEADSAALLILLTSNVGLGHGHV